MPLEILEKSATERKTGASSISIEERIKSALSREKGQRIFVKKVGTCNYRINWYAECELENSVKSWKIVDSKFLHVEDSGTSLVIVDKTK